MKAHETFDALWEYCTANERVVPAPQRWNELFQMLCDTRQLPSGGWEPPLPLILAAWHDTPALLKQLRLKEHIEWAGDHGQLDEVGRFLRSLDEKEWFHFGEL